MSLNTFQSGKNIEKYVGEDLLRFNYEKTDLTEAVKNKCEIGT